jgi:ribosomal protein S10
LVSNFHLNFNLISAYPKNFEIQQPVQAEPYSVVYNFTFVSLIAPYLLNDLRLSNISNSPSTPGKSTILIKQSYLLFTWFYYLKTSVMKTKTKNKVIKFAFLPIRRKSYTLTKAPIAHKTNSKEQFVFKFYKFKASVHTYYTVSNRLISVDQGLEALIMTKRTFPFFETNVLLLKTAKVVLSLSDSTYFDYNNYISSNVSTS